MRWVIWLRSPPLKSNTNLSAYWCRIGSDFGSQFGFFFRFRTVVWSQMPSRMYGPEETKSASYLVPSYLAFGTGVLVGSAARNGISGCALSKENLIVLSSTTVTPGGTSPLSGVQSRLGFSAACTYCGPWAPRSPIDWAMP